MITVKVYIIEQKLVPYIASAQVSYSMGMETCFERVNEINYKKEKTKRTGGFLDLVMEPRLEQKVTWDGIKEGRIVKIIQEKDQIVVHIEDPEIKPADKEEVLKLENIILGYKLKESKLKEKHQRERVDKYFEKINSERMDALAESQEIKSKRWYKIGSKLGLI